mgnify:FL=1
MLFRSNYIVFQSPKEAANQIRLAAIPIPSTNLPWVLTAAIDATDTLTAQQGVFGIGHAETTNGVIHIWGIRANGTTPALECVSYATPTSSGALETGDPNIDLRTIQPQAKRILLRVQFGGTTITNSWAWDVPGKSPSWHFARSLTSYSATNSHWVVGVQDSGNGSNTYRFRFVTAGQ